MGSEKNKEPIYGIFNYAADQSFVMSCTQLCRPLYMYQKTACHREVDE